MDTATLITQLRVLVHLTRTEAQVARLRVAQASTDDVRRELAQNAADADARARRMVGVLRDLGALPDPVGPVLGPVIALVRGAVEQTQPLDEALLSDLALEHQLRERARYVGALARSAALPEVAALADDLVAAHTETVGWLAGVLADVAHGRESALTASPLQRVAGQVTRVVNAPTRTPADGAERSVDEGDQATAALAGEPDRIAGEATSHAASPGRLPIPGFADLDAHTAIAALRTLDDPDDVAAVLAFEQAHGNRSALIAAARARADAVRG